MHLLRQTARVGTALDSPFPIDLTNVSAGYDGALVLHAATASFPRSALSVLGGRNGAGKSTLLGVLAGTIPANEGTVARHPAERVGFVVQRSAVSDLLPLTVRETVAMGRWGERWLPTPLSDHDRSIIEGCLDLLGLTILANRPLGSLSGGQRQRALVAQGLARQSSLLVLDEPTVGVDLHTSEVILLAIRSETERGAAVVVATHDAALMAEADHRLTLADGRIIPG